MYMFFMFFFVFPNIFIKEIFSRKNYFFQYYFFQYYVTKSDVKRRVKIAILKKIVLN